MEYISKQKAVDKLMFEASLRGMSYTAEAYEMAAKMIDQIAVELPDERIKQIADYYGPVQQKEQLIEECSELILASLKCKRDGTRAAFDNFCEEVADVYIMVQQMMYLISPEVIGEIIDKKLDRQIQRIKDESEPETDVIYQDDKVRAIKVTGWENDKKDGDAE